MKKRICLFFLIAIICGCNKRTQSNQQQPSMVQNDLKKNSKLTILNFSEPIQIDSSVYVMYPLEISHDESPSSFESSSSRGSYYWNMIFLNTETGKYHLLDSVRKMLIRGYDAGKSSNRVSQDGIGAAKNYLFYSVIVNDADKNGDLNENDPDYLFVSDKQGNNFKQISPNNFDVRSWQVIDKTDNVLIYAVNSGDKTSSNDEKEIIPFVYNLKTGAAPNKIFSEKFIQNTKTLLSNKWAKDK